MTKADARKEKIQTLHREALQVTDQYFKSEARLLEILQKLDAMKGYLDFEETSLFGYAVHQLKLSESVALNLISVARKSVQVPDLKREIEAGHVNLSAARLIVPVLTPENQNEWIERAKNLSCKDLQKEVARIAPQEATPERVSYVAEDRVKLSLGLDEKSLEALKRVQDLESQRQMRAVSLEETLEVLSQLYLAKNDPILKAKRAEKKFKPYPTKTFDSYVALQTEFIKREPIPALLKHEVTLRDGAQCSHRNSQGHRCPQKRWLQVHHVKPVSLGGQSTFENLMTLCSVHHKLLHERENGS